MSMMRSLCIRNPLDEEDKDELMTSSPSSSLSDEEEFKALCLVIFQCLANYIQDYELSNHIWGKLYQTNVVADMVMISVRCKRRKHLSVVLNILYNCIRLERPSIHEVENGGRSIERYLKIDELMANRQLLCQILLAIIDCCESNSQSQFALKLSHQDIISTSNCKEASEVDPVMSWMYLFLELLMKHGRISQLFLVVGPTTNGYDYTHATMSDRYMYSQITDTLQHTKCTINYEQLILINCIIDIIDDESCNYVDDLQRELSALRYEDIMDLKAQNPSIETESTYSNKSSHDLWTFVHILAQHLISAIDVMNLGYRPENRNGGPTDSDMFDEQLKNSSLLHSMRLLSSVMIKFFSEGRTLLGQNVRKSLVLTFPTVIRAIVSLLPQDAAITRSHSSSMSGTVPHIDVDNDLVKSTLRFIAAIIYDCKESQDELRICGGLATVLSYCGTDFTNPLSREWALFCVKNACDNNEENVNFIDSLKPTKVFQHAILESRGIRVDLDCDGKLAFNDMKNAGN